MEALAAIANLAQIAQLALQLGYATGPVVPDIRGILDRLAREDRLSLEQKVARDLPGAEELVALFIIDADLLDTIEGEVRKCIEAYQAFGTSGHLANREVNDRSAERCVCENLNWIKRRNGGKLPSGPFENWWRSYRCVDDHDY